MLASGELHTALQMEDCNSDEGPGPSNIASRGASLDVLGAVNTPQTPPTSHNSRQLGQRSGYLHSNEIAPPLQTAARKAFQRKHLAEYKKQQKLQLEKKVQIPTDENGEITALRNVLHTAIRDIAGRVLNFAVIDFCEHPAACLNYIEHDLAQQFYFDPPLKKNYVIDYLKDHMCTARYQWRCFWLKNNTRHHACPAKHYDALVEYWKTPEAKEESKRMRQANRMRRAAIQKKVRDEANSLHVRGPTNNTISDGLPNGVISLDLQSFPCSGDSGLRHLQLFWKFRMKKLANNKQCTV